MSDDLLAISISSQFKTAKSSVDPWMVKHWTVQKDYAWKATKLVVKPASAIRNGFMAIYNAVKGIGSGRKHQ